MNRLADGLAARAEEEVGIAQVRGRDPVGADIERRERHRRQPVDQGGRSQVGAGGRIGELHFTVGHSGARGDRSDPERHRLAVDRRVGRPARPRRHGSSGGDQQACRLRRTAVAEPRGIGTRE